MTEIARRESGEITTGTGGPMEAMIALAEKGTVSVEVMERMLDMQERILERDARMAFVQAMAAFQAECPTIKKTKVAKVVSKRTGSSYSYTYAPIEEIVRTVRPILALHGLSYAFDGAVDGKNYTAIAKLKHIHGHSETASFTVPIEDTGQKSGPQEVGSARSYARRYALCDVLGLATAEDDDDGVSGYAEPILPKVGDKIGAELQALAATSGVNVPEMFKFYGVASFSDMDPTQAQAARKIMENRIEKAEKAGKGS